MKKLSIFTAAALMLAAVSCNKEAAPIAEPVQGTPAVQKITFTAYADNGADTRTILDGNDIKWAAGETIYVFDGTAPRAFTSTNTAEAAIVTFEGEAAVAGTYTAVSPAATMTGSTINATIPVFQTATADSFDPKANVSVAVANGGPDVDLTNLDLQFKNAGAVVKFKLSNTDVTKVRLDAIGGEKLAGKASITLNGNIPSVTMASDAESCVILKPASGNFSTDATYAIAIAPGTYAQGFKLTLIKADGKYKSFSNTASQTLERNKMMDFGTIPEVSKWKVAEKDVLTRTDTGITTNNYGDWTAQGMSGAVYSGNSAGGNESIQLRTKTNSGIVVTSSSKKVSSVTVDWNSETVSARKVDIYGKNSAYGSPADLYNSNTKGTLLGSIDNSKGETTLSINGDYEFIGIMANGGAIYLNSITVAWGAGTAAPTDPNVTPVVFNIDEPESSRIPAAGGSASFTVNANIPWTLSLDSEDIATYETSVSGEETTVTVTMGAISTGSRMITFTITPFGGDPSTVSFTQAAGYTELFTITSGDVVSNSSYKAHTATVDNRNWVITFGGNNKSVGTNSSSRGNCNLSSYQKYAVGVTTSATASAFASTSKIDNVAKIKYTYSGGKNTTSTKVYLLYSADNTTFSAISLNSLTPQQGGGIVSSGEYEFNTCSGYFALLFVATNSSGDWRIDDVNVTYYGF